MEALLITIGMIVILLYSYYSSRNTKRTLVNPAHQDLSRRLLKDRRLLFRFRKYYV